MDCVVCISRRFPNRTWHPTATIKIKISAGKTNPNTQAFLLGELNDKHAGQRRSRNPPLTRQANVSIFQLVATEYQSVPGYNESRLNSRQLLQMFPRRHVGNIIHMFQAAISQRQLALSGELPRLLPPGNSFPCLLIGQDARRLTMMDSLFTEL